MGEICAICVLRPSHYLQRSQFASSSIGVRHLLQSLATPPLAGPNTSLRRDDVSPAASLSKDRRGTCARRVTSYLPGRRMTSFCALQHAANFKLALTRAIEPTGGPGASHSRTVPSSDAVTSRLPSGLNAALFTGPSWPFKLAISLPPSASHTARSARLDPEDSGANEPPWRLIGEPSSIGAEQLSLIN